MAVCEGGCDERIEHERVDTCGPATGATVKVDRPARLGPVLTRPGEEVRRILTKLVEIRMCVRAGLAGLSLPRQDDTAAGANPSPR